MLFDVNFSIRYAFFQPAWKLHSYCSLSLYFVELLGFTFYSSELGIFNPSKNCKCQTQLPLKVKRRGTGSQSKAETTDLAAQFIHQGHNGVLEEGGRGQWSLGDFCDAQLTIWPHLLQDWVGTTIEKGGQEKGAKTKRGHHNWVSRGVLCKKVTIHLTQLQNCQEHYDVCHLLYMRRLKSWKSRSLFLSKKPSTEYL